MADDRPQGEETTRSAATPARGAVARAAALLSLPSSAVFVTMAGIGVLSPLQAGVGIALSVPVIALMVRRHFQELAILGQHLDDRGQAPDLEAALTDRRGATSLIGDAGQAADLALSLERADSQLVGWVEAARQETASRERIIASIPDPLLVVDDRTRIVSANTAAEGRFGARIVGRDLSAVIRHPDVLSAVQATLTDSTSGEVEFEIAAPIARTFNVRIEALPEDPTRQAGAVLLFVDLSAVRRAEQMRVDFIANVSHELRTPLATLMGFIETLQGPARDDGDAHDRFLEIMRVQALRMSRLVNDLLSLSRIETNEHTRPTGRVDLARVIDGVKATLDLEARRKDMQIQVDVRPDQTEVIGDEDELTQVVQNLLDNAIKYGKSGTLVDVTATPAERVPAAYPGAQDRAVLLSVRDRGDGIEAAQIARLTERFYRVDTARSRELGGTGLGLAIVKHIVSRHRGALSIASDLGDGTTVSVFLPGTGEDRSGGTGTMTPG